MVDWDKLCQWFYAYDEEIGIAILLLASLVSVIIVLGVCCG